MGIEEWIITNLYTQFLFGIGAIIALWILAMVYIVKHWEKVAVLRFSRINKNSRDRSSLENSLRRLYSDSWRENVTSRHEGISIVICQYFQAKIESYVGSYYSSYFWCSYRTPLLISENLNFITTICPLL